jgi:hypothetical protein
VYLVTPVLPTPLDAADGGGLPGVQLGPAALGAAVGLAACRPSGVPSTISSRWNSSIAPRMWKTSRPVGVVVWMCCLRMLRITGLTPRERSSSARGEQVLQGPHQGPGDNPLYHPANVGARRYYPGHGR